MLRWNKRDGIFAVIASAVLLIDQGIKWLVFSREVAFESAQLEIGVFWNEGIAFSIRLPEVVMSLFIAVALLFVLFVYKRELKRFPLKSAVACAFVVGGAASNIVDRFRFGKVLDYVLIGNTSMFNIADVFVIAGLAVILFLVHRERNKA